MARAYLGRQSTATERWIAPDALSLRFGPEDASLRAWLEASESMERWWMLDVAATRDDASLAEDWLAGQGGQRLEMAVTVTGAEGPGRSLHDVEPLATRPAPTEAEAGAGGDDIPASLRDAEGDADAPPWEDTPRREAAAVAAAIDGPHIDPRATVHVNTAIGSVWSQAEAVLLVDDQPAWLAPEANQMQDMPDEIALHPTARLTARDGRVIVVNVNGLDDADIADLAVEQYEAAQARRRFRAHVPG